MDWATRKVLSWRLSNTMEADICVEALREAMDRYGKPEIFNTIQPRKPMADPTPRRGSMATRGRTAVDPPRLAAGGDPINRQIATSASDAPSPPTGPIIGGRNTPETLHR